MSKNRSPMTIIADPNKCVGCLRCQLICSFQKSKGFNPNKSQIIINDNGLYVDKITFLDGCECCGMCVKYCTYGALLIKKGTQI